MTQPQFRSSVKSVYLFLRVLYHSQLNRWCGRGECNFDRSHLTTDCLASFAAIVLRTARTARRHSAT